MKERMRTMKAHNDPENYRKMSEPFADIDKANEAIDKFFDMVEKARNECRISDAHVIVQFGVIGKEGKEGTAITAAHFGFSMNAARMCAWSLGQEQAAQENIIREFVKGK